MSDQTALLRAIIDNPDDDLPRQILADWLEDRNGLGDHACSQFIRAQCALRQMGMGDPRRPEQEALEQALVPRHPRRWAKPIRGLVRSWTYDRGLVGGVKIQPAALPARAAKLFESAPIQRLEIATVAGCAALVQGLPQARSLRGLVLHNDSNGGQAAGREADALLTGRTAEGLRELIAFAIPLVADVWQRIPWAAHAERVDVRYAASIAGRLGRALGGRPFPALRSLRIDLGYYGGGAVPDRSLPSLRQLEIVVRNLQLRGSPHGGTVENLLIGVDVPLLEELVLTSQYPSWGLPHAELSVLLDRLATLPVRSLGLVGWALDGRALTTLLAHRIAPSLARLRLGLMNEKSFRPLAASSSLAQLHTLHLDGEGNDSPLDVQTLFEGPLAHRLSILKLHRMGVRAADLLRLHASPLRDSVRLLDLSHNGLGDEAGEALAEFDSWPRLVCLKVRRTGLGAGVLRDLRQVLGERLQY